MAVMSLEVLEISELLPFHTMALFGRLLRPHALLDASELLSGSIKAFAGLSLLAEPALSPLQNLQEVHHSEHLLIVQNLLLTCQHIAARAGCRC